ncbi:MAG: HD domain-containing protein, partial [Desulfobulbaceae bacterium]|nr:HD domain-containing protein [Desulfobulbaceae bacterium]
IIREADFLLFALPAILHHHERFDGKGYPNRLTENQLSLMARIIAVADTYDAITTKRPYSKAMPPAEAFSELRKNAGTQFDPEIVKAFERVILSEKRK